MIFLLSLYSFLQTASTEVQFGPMKLIKDPLQVQWNWCFLDESTRLWIPSIKTRRGRNPEMGTLWRNHGVVTATKPNIYSQEHTKMNSAVQRIHGPFVTTNRTFCDIEWFVYTGLYLQHDVLLKATGCCILGLQDEFWWMLWLKKSWNLTLDRALLGFCLFHRFHRLLNENNNYCFAWKKWDLTCRCIRSI